MNFEIFGSGWPLMLPAYILVGAVYALNQRKYLSEEGANMAGMCWPIHGIYFSFSVLVEFLSEIQWWWKRL